MRIPLFTLIPLCLSVISSSLFADLSNISIAGRRADRIEDKKFEAKSWSQSNVNQQFQNRTFAFKNWDKHYSSIGSKRSAISLSDGFDREIFKTEVIEHETWSSGDLSRWNERMAALHRDAGIEMDDRARIAADRQLYNMMLQDTSKFPELGEQVSLRDINRFQFRRNRSDTLPVQKAGSDE